MTQAPPEEAIPPTVCPRCGCTFKTDVSRSDFYVAIANHNVAHDLAESLTASPGLREHLQFVLNHDAPEAPF